MSPQTEQPLDLYADHSGRTTIAIGFGIALPVVAVSLRLLSRFLRDLRYGPDDYMIIVAAILTIGNALVPVWANKGGNGRHMEILTKEDLELYELSLFIFEQTFGAAICAVKLSVLLLYRRIFATPQFKRWTTILGSLTVLWLIIKNLVGAFQCTPVQKAWKKSLPGHCPINFINNVLGAQAFNVVLDIAILVLPITAIYRLHLPKYKKLGVMAVFAVGIFTIVVALLRLSIIAQEIVRYNLNDVTWFTAKFSWTIMDPAVGCFVSCMPTWTPLAGPLQRVPMVFISLRSLITRSRSRGSKMGTMLPGESGEFQLPQYRQDNAKAVITTVAGTQSEHRTTVPQPGKVTIRRDFSQIENSRASDVALL